MKGYAEKRRLLRFEKGNVKPRTEKEKGKNSGSAKSSTQKEIV